MCNRIIQDKIEIKPNQRIKVVMRGPGGEFDVEFGGAIFAGPARSESKEYWLHREHAEPVIVPGVTRYGEKNKATGEQGYEDLPDVSALEGLLLPTPPGKDYRLLKVLTQPATPEQFERLGNDRAPVIVKK